MRATRGRGCPGTPRLPRSGRPPCAPFLGRPPACSRSIPARPWSCRARTTRAAAALLTELRVGLASQCRQDGLLDALRLLARQRTVRRAKGETERPSLATGCDPLAAILVVQLDRLEQRATGVLHHVEGMARRSV